MAASRATGGCSTTRGSSTDGRGSAADAATFIRDDLHEHDIAVVAVRALCDGGHAVCRPCQGRSRRAEFSTMRGRVPSNAEVHMDAQMNRIPRLSFLVATAAAAMTLNVVIAASHPWSQAPTPAAPQAQVATQPASGPTGFTTTPPLKFRVQEIAADFGVGYAVAPGDVNGD